jgi:2-polyprenyl-3-methyl-5-hydroxy-6-metoxy-1,4-benzoquinol methylase
MIDLAGDVDGHRVLDAGCGSGPLSAALRAKGAIVTGFDGSPAMLELARQRLGNTSPSPSIRRRTPSTARAQC